MPIRGVVRELLVRYLDVWTPRALHARRLTFAYATGGEPDVELAEAALRVFAEFADRLRGRQLTMLVVAPETATVAARLAAVQAELGTPPALAVHTATAGLSAGLRAAGTAKAPLLVHLDTTGRREPALLPVVAAGRPGELLLTGGAGWAAERAALRAAGFPLTAGVELVDGDAELLVGFATPLGRNLEAFKNELWAVDEYAGVRFRDPADPEGHLLDISLAPHPGPLRRELLTHLRDAGPRTVAQLREFTMTGTVYRAADTGPALHGLLSSAAVTRTPAEGRLTGDVTITAA